VFLDEIGDMPLDMQAKLLRVLQDGELRPVGANETVKVDVRVLGATNKDLVAMTRAGTFREDLYFRLNVIRIELPPLREREGDVEFLVRALLRRQAEKVGREVRLSPEARAALVAWTWPGNVRELENELLRAVAMSSGTIEVVDLSDGVAGRK
jgi:transcriptional regulator with GAF, ATPase, and Fis domain